MINSPGVSVEVYDTDVSFKETRGFDANWTIANTDDESYRR
jgi:hypothetical protein